MSGLEVTILRPGLFFHFSRLFVYTLQYTRLLAFELLITLLVFFAKIDSKLQMLAVDAAVRTNFARSTSEPEHCFPDRGLFKLKDGLAAVRIEQRPANERAAPTCQTVHSMFLNLNLNACSFINPSASCWSYAPASSSKVAMRSL